MKTWQRLRWTLVLGCDRVLHRRPTNAALLNSLPDLHLPTRSIIDDLDAGRAER